MDFLRGSLAHCDDEVTMATNWRDIHDFCWINLVTPDVERAASFFSRIFGWKYQELPGVPGGRLIRVGEGLAGAFMDQHAPGMPAEMAAVIGVMVRVADADTTVAKMNAAGGKAGQAFDVLDNGRMAVCFDPTGANLDIWQPKGQGTLTADSRAHGTPSWFELMSNDVVRATSFYTEVFGWNAEPQPMPGGTYTVFKLGDRMIAGAMSAPDDRGNVPAHWGTYFTVKNAEETYRQARELGASSCVPVTPIPGGGRFAMLQSPQGVPFRLIEYAS